MADVKISALPLATTPLAGTEVLPIVQSATTDQVSVANLTAGRAVSAASLTLTTTPLAVGSGGTGLSTLTAGYIPYGNGTSAFSSSSGLTFGVSTWGTAANPALVIQGTNGSYGGRSGALTFASYDGLSNVTIANDTGLQALQFYIGTSEKMRLDASGNLGLNNTSPSTYANGQGATLVVGSTVNWATIQGRTDGPAGAGNGVSYGGSYSTNPINGARIFVAASGSGGQQGQILFYTKNVDDNVTQPSVRMTLDPSGRLGIGATSPTRLLQVYSTTDSYQMRLGYSDSYYYDIGRSGSDGLFYFYGNQSGANGYVFDGVNGERARIDASGNLLVGTTSQGGSYNGRFVTSTGSGLNGILVKDTQANGAIACFVNSSNAQAGTITISGTTTTYGTSSDARLKENVVPAESSLASILAFPVDQFDWKAGGHTDYGCVAQKAIKYAPEMVVPGETWVVDYGRITPRLIKAFQELAAKVSALEAKQ